MMKWPSVAAQPFDARTNLSDVVAVIIVECQKNPDFFTQKPSLIGRVISLGQENVPQDRDKVLLSLLSWIIDITQNPSVLLQTNSGANKIVTRQGLREAVVRIAKQQRSISDLHRAIPLIVFALHDSRYIDTARKQLASVRNALRIPLQFVDNTQVLPCDISALIGSYLWDDPFLSFDPRIDELATVLDQAVHWREARRNPLGLGLATACLNILNVRLSEQHGERSMIKHRLASK